MNDQTNIMNEQARQLGRAVVWAIPAAINLGNGGSNHTFRDIIERCEQMAIEDYNDPDMAEGLNLLYSVLVAYESDLLDMILTGKKVEDNE